MLKTQARAKVGALIAKGAYVRPDHCEKCGKAPERMANGRSRVQAHMPDPTNPYVIEWRCPACRKETAPAKLPRGITGIRQYRLA